MRPVLEQSTLAKAHVIEMLRTVAIKSRTKNQMMRALDALDGVDLDEAKLLNGFLHRNGASAPRRVGKQALAVKQESAGVGGGECW
jgi:hypothetical protein